MTTARRIAATGTYLLAVAFTALCASTAGAHQYYAPGSGERPDADSFPSAALYETFGFTIPRQRFPVSVVFVGQPAPDLSTSDVEASIAEAAGVWNQVPCSFAELKWAGFRRTPEDVADDEVPVYFTDAFANQPNRLARTPIPGTSPPDGFSVQVNERNFRWSTDAQPFHRLDDDSQRIASLPAVLTHEFGHLLGLAHTEAHNAATMAARYLSDGSQTELTADDKLGLCSLYPHSEGECREDTDCPPGAGCIAGEHGAVCDAYVADVGEYCGVEFSRCRHHCHLDEEELGIGYCTEPCQDDADCPDHFACRDALEQRECRFAAEFDETPASGGCSSAPLSAPPLVVLLVVLWITRRFATRSSPPAGSRRCEGAHPDGCR